MRLFRALLAADLDLQKKTTGNNQLLIVFFFAGDSRRAKAAAAAFAAGDIRGMSVDSEATNDTAAAGMIA